MKSVPRAAPAASSVALEAPAKIPPSLSVIALAAFERPGILAAKSATLPSGIRNDPIVARLLAVLLRLGGGPPMPRGKAGCPHPRPDAKLPWPRLVLHRVELAIEPAADAALEAPDPRAEPAEARADPMAPVT